MKGRAKALLFYRENQNKGVNTLLNLNHWKNYDNLSRAEYFNQSKIKALVAQVKKVKKW